MHLRYLFGMNVDESVHILLFCFKARLNELSAQAEETVLQMESLPSDQRQLMDRLRQKVRVTQLGICRTGLFWIWIPIVFASWTAG